MDMSRIHLVVVLISVLSMEVQSQVSRKVLFLGNSYTAYNNLPQLVHDVALSAGDTLVFDSHTPGGYTLEAHTLDNTSINKINVGDWDHVVLQGQSREPILQPTIFRDAGNDLRNAIYQSNPCTVPLFYMTWGRKNGDPTFCDDFPVVCTYESMDNSLRGSYENMVDVFNAEVSPVSVVWRYLRDNHPAIDLYAGDGSHPSAAGSYAAACCFYAAIFKHDPTLITDNFSLTNADAAAIRNAAKVVVYDDLASWDYKVMPNSSFYYTIGSGTNQVLFSSPGFGAIQWHAWDFGDGGSASTFNPTHSYASNGSYTVELTTTNCDVEGIHTSISDTVIQFCDHTPTVFSSKAWLCNYDTLWTEPADSYQWLSGGQAIPETGSSIANYQRYNSFTFSVVTTENGCSELSQPYAANPAWSGYYYDAAWGGDPCAGDTALLIVKHADGFLPASSIVRWYRNGTLLTSENNKDTLLIWEEGDYLGMAVDPNSDCPKDSTFFTVVYDCGMDTTDTVGNVDTLDTIAGLPRLRNNSNDQFIVYPNPATTLLTLFCQGACNNETVEVFDAMGRLVESIQFESFMTLDVSDWPDGMYFLIRPRSGEAHRFFKR